MLKNAIKRKIQKRIIVSSMTLLILLLIYLVPSNKTFEENINYANNLNYVYLLNKDSLLIRTSVISNEDDTIEKAKEIISSLTINSNKSNYITKDYKQIIPENTKVLEISLENDLLKINFSKEFLNISEKLEEEAIESLIYSLTELDNIDKIMIFTEGTILNQLPNSKKILPIPLDRNYGINKVYDITTLSSVNKVTLYYFMNIDNKYNAVPVTIFTNNSNDKVEVIIKNLKSSSIYQTDLVSFLNDNIELLDYEIAENEVKLNFNTALLDSFYDDSLLEEVKYALSSSLKDSLNVKEVSYYINGQKI